MASEFDSGLNAEELEKQYNPRLAVDDPQEIFDRWVAQSEVFESRTNVLKDVRYAAGHDEQLLDIYPAARSGAPTLIFIHGGYWRAMSKDFYSFCLEPIVAAGIAVASVNYTLCPAVELAEIISQTRAACTWAWRNIATYKGDRDNIHIAGHSAGGHLTAAMMTTDWHQLDPMLPVDLVKSGIPISGVFDLEPLRATTINEDVGLTAESARDNSPLFQTPAWPMPMTACVGGAESEEFRRQSQHFSETWAPHLARSNYVEVGNANHFTIIEGMTSPDSPVTQAILNDANS